MKLKAKDFAWIYLLKEGTVGEWSFYGGSYSHDKEGTQKAFHDIVDYGIDWKKTKAPTDSYEESFVGTDCEYSDNHQTMEGLIYTNNGKRYRFGCKFESGNIFKVMEEVSGIDSVEAMAAKLILKEL